MATQDQTTFGLKIGYGIIKKKSIFMEGCITPLQIIEAHVVGLCINFYKTPKHSVLSNVGLSYVGLCINFLLLIKKNNNLCDSYNGILDQKTINQAYSNKQMIFGMIDNINLFVRKEDGKIYIEYIINEVENK